MHNTFNYHLHLGVQDPGRFQIPVSVTNPVKQAVYPLSVPPATETLETAFIRDLQKVTHHSTPCTCGLEKMQDLRTLLNDFPEIVTICVKRGYWAVRRGVNVQKVNREALRVDAEFDLQLNGVTQRYALFAALLHTGNLVKILAMQ